MARSSYDYGGYPPYVPVAVRRRQAEREVAALRKKGRTITPVAIAGRHIAASFWGKSWCHNLEAYSDYESRLPRGRAYVRNGSVVHLEIGPGKVEALVRGSAMYTVTIEIDALPSPRWSAVVEECSGQIDSLVELLQGKLSKGVMEVVTHKERGLFPSPDEIELTCSCPDWAGMCKHVAAVLYGVGARLDTDPALLFRLRKVDPAALLHSESIGRAGRQPPQKLLATDALASLFGIELDDGTAPPAPAPVEAAAVSASTPRRRQPAPPRRTKRRR